MEMSESGRVRSHWLTPWDCLMCHPWWYWGTVVVFALVSYLLILWTVER
jgi:hypothetical protein